VAETKLTLMVFQGVPETCRLFAAQSKGFFGQSAISRSTSRVRHRNSQELARRFFAQGALSDRPIPRSTNAGVAMAEQAKIDIAVLVGGDNGWNNLYVQPENQELRPICVGKNRLIVDAVDTAFAFQLYQNAQAQRRSSRGEYEVKPIGATRFPLGRDAEQQELRPQRC